MIKPLLTFILFLSSLSLSAQNASNTNTSNNMNSSINLSGQASKKYTPDLARVDFALTSRMKTHQLAISQLQDNSKDLITRLEKLGFSKEQIKLTAYNVNQEFDYTDNKQRLSGYNASQSMHLEFKWDIDKLDALFKSFADQPSDDIAFSYGSVFSLEFTQSIKTELIEKAIQDADAKAELIAKTSRLKIIGIKDISYSVATPGPMPIMLRGAMMAESGVGLSPGMPDIGINETEFSENIQIIYLAEKL